MAGTGKPADDMVGNKFGRWTVIKRNGRVGSLAMWLCRCECGKESTVPGARLRGGKSKSCGCLRSVTATTHGKTKSLEYSSWYHMKGRCYDPRDKRYKDYGGRGIMVCDRWLHNFENFLADMGNRPGPEYSIDRIDVNKNYEPSNCKWSTIAEQRNNRRDSKQRQW